MGLITTAISSNMAATISPYDALVFLGERLIENSQSTNLMGTEDSIANI
jgi:hypothetical protein